MIDGRTISSGEVLDADVCVIGAGAAGITLAREFAESKLRVLLLESGGLEGDMQTQLLYQGEIAAHAYFPLEACRLRYFGGSTNHWAGWCRPLDPEIFEARDWVPHSGWPITRQILDPYYERAGVVCQLSPAGFKTAAWEKHLPGPPLPLEDSRITTTMFQFSPRIGFGRVWGDVINRAANIRVVLHASVTELKASGNGAAIEEARVKTLAGNAWSVRARHFIVATGGIANPQLLLASHAGRRYAPGNEHDLVGRFFMEHPHYNRSALFSAASGFYRLPFYQRSASDRNTAMGVLILTPETRAQERLLSVNLSFEEKLLDYGTGYKSLKRIFSAFGNRRLPQDGVKQLKNVILDVDDVAAGVRRKLQGRPSFDYEISWRSEQQPNPASRVMLADDCDALGMPRVQLHWQLTREDLRSIRRTQEIVAAELGRAGIGRLRLPEEDERYAWADKIVGGSHHMGTTRMADDPKLGVVDRHCRVHGVSNLHIAGSSVFPTAGSSNPTLTIVALAIRLADRIKEVAA